MNFINTVNSISVDMMSNLTGTKILLYTFKLLSVANCA